MRMVYGNGCVAALMLVFECNCFLFGCLMSLSRTSELGYLVEHELFCESANLLKMIPVPFQTLKAESCEESVRQLLKVGNFESCEGFCEAISSVGSWEWRMFVWGETIVVGSKQPTFIFLTPWSYYDSFQSVVCW